MISALMLPIVMLFMVVLVLIGSIGSAVANVANGGIISYNEETFQRYADTEYAKAFDTTTAYENNLLLVLLTNEECDGYYAIAWVGDNVETEINVMFGDETTEFGRVVQGSINGEYYAYSLDSNLATVMDKMAGKIEALGLEDPFKRPIEETAPIASHMVNYTDLQLTPNTVNTALEDFTARTDIPVVIVVDTMENVFGKTMPIGDIVLIVVMLGLAALSIYLIVKAVRNRKNGGDDDRNNRANGNSDGFEHIRF